MPIVEFASKENLKQVADKVINGVEYDRDPDSSTYRKINFYHVSSVGDTLIASLDATPFVMDGMVDSVKVKDGNLVLTFNTDAGKQAIRVPLTQIFNPDNYYTKADTEKLIANTPDFIEEENSAAELGDEYLRLRTEIYQALVDAQTVTDDTIKATRDARNVITSTTAAIDNTNAATNAANAAAALAIGKAAEIEDAKGGFSTLSKRLENIEEEAGDIEFIEDDSDNFDF